MKDKSNTACLPPGHRIYAVGDIHGRLDCLKDILQKMRNHMQQHPVADSAVVFLGDYIDRGPHSMEVVDCLLEHSIPAKAVYLMGNHEYVLLLFLKGEFPYKHWLRWGGDATLASYGVAPCLPDADEMEVEEMRAQLEANMPAAHKAFFSQLQLMHEAGDYLFVHAGIRPGVELEKQQMEDLLFIREDFLNEPVSIDKTIIHGHTVFKKPFIREKSIGIDTGAYATGILTALILENNTYEFLHSSL